MVAATRETSTTARCSGLTPCRLTRARRTDLIIRGRLIVAGHGPFRIIRKSNILRKRQQSKRCRASRNRHSVKSSLKPNKTLRRKRANNNNSSLRQTADRVRARRIQLTTKERRRQRARAARAADTLLSLGASTTAVATSTTRLTWTIRPAEAKPS